MTFLLRPSLITETETTQEIGFHDKFIKFHFSRPLQLTKHVHVLKFEKLNPGLFRVTQHFQLFVMRNPKNLFTSVLWEADFNKLFGPGKIQFLAFLGLPTLAG